MKASSFYEIKSFVFDLMSYSCIRSLIIAVQQGN
jgi:hypothetical protein